MAGSNYIYRFLSSVWDFLPKKEKDRYAELWKGYEQVFADVYQRFVDLDLSVNVNKMPVYLITRWNKYTFNSTNAQNVAAQLTSFQDLSRTANLTSRFLIKFSIDGGTPIEVDCRGRNPAQTTITEIIAKINSAAGFTFARGVFENTLINLKTKTVGPTAQISILTPSLSAQDGTELILGIAPEQYPYTVPRLPYRYALSDSKIRSIPSLQDKIRNEKLTYYIIEGPNFEINWREEYISFKEQPLETLWARITYIDEEMPFHNFGYLIDYRDTEIDPEDYLQNLQGLWFAFWQGPRPEFIKRALGLLFSLPSAVSNGVVIRERESMLDILHDDGITRSYALPSQLEWTVGAGEYVERFQLLTTGIDVFDKTNLPGFVTTEIGREGISPFALPEATKGSGSNTDETKALKALEEHTFLPQINVNAFVRPNINVGSIFRFLSNIKPLQKQFYFQVIIAVFGEDLGLDERFGMDLSFDITPNLEINQANWAIEAVRETYETLSYPALDLDSDVLGFFERGNMSVSDNTGPLPQYDVVFD